MRRLLAVLVPLALLAACGDDDDVEPAATTVVDGEASERPSGSDEPGDDEADDDDDEAEDDEADDDGAAAPETTVPETTVPTDSPAGDAPGDGDDDEGLGDALLVSDLAGGSEVPGPGDPAATGRFEAELHDGVLCVDMAVSGLGAAVSGAHLHEGAAGEAGPVIVDIGGPTAAGDPVRWVDACTEVADDVIQKIADAPERVYVNVHTTAHPDGAVRGQLAVTSVFDRTL